MTGPDIALSWIAADDSRMADAHALRHEVLFAPFGIVRDDSWDDAGSDRYHLVAYENARIVGYACLIVEPDGTGHVRQVSVGAERRERGIGTMLMREAEAEAGRRGVRRVWLNARRTAERFYVRLGYETVSGEFASGRTGLPHVRMERVLG